MPASLKTQNFDFPLYQPQDLFAPLTDFNLLSNGVDRNLMLVKTAADSAEAMSSANELDIQEIETWKAGLMQQLQYLLEPQFVNFNPLQPGVLYAYDKNYRFGNIWFVNFKFTYNLADMTKVKVSEVNNFYKVLSTPTRLLPANHDITNPAALGIGYTTGLKGAEENVIINFPQFFVTQTDNIMEVWAQYSNATEAIITGQSVETLLSSPMRLV